MDKKRDHLFTAESRGAGCLPFFYAGKDRSRVKKRGFTLIELLIVSSMLAMVSFAIYSIFNSGIKVWQRMEKPVKGEDIGIFFDKFNLDLKNAFRFETIEFIGGREKLGFATIFYSARFQNSTVGKVMYIFSSQANTLSRIEKDYSAVCQQENGIIDQSIKGVDSLRFMYYGYNDAKKAYSWHDEWQEDGLPLAVRVILKTGDDHGEELTKTVSIPVGG